MSEKIAIVTGGNRGLGRSTALKLAESGVDVILTYHSHPGDGVEVVSAIEQMGRRAVALALDVADSRSFADFSSQAKYALARHWQRGAFDYLVNNAGVGIHASLQDTTEEQFETLFQVHLKGVFFLTQALLPLMADGGRIVNISSGLTRCAQPGYAAYAAMKGAVEVLSRYMAVELGPRGIAVNVVAPGATETDFGGGAVRDNRQLNSQIAARTALGRVGQPDDIGGAIAALLQPGNAWVNAQRIEVSGGVSI